METKSLFNISAEIEEILGRITEAGGELTPEVESDLAAVSSALIQKADQCVAWRDKMLMLHAHAMAKIEEIENFAKQVNNKIEKFDEYVSACLERLPDQKIQGEFISIKFRKPPLAVDVFDESQLPIDFIKLPEPKPQIMKAEIAKALKSGEQVPGARLVDGKKSLIYKVGKE
jgi:hypothetical protein